MSAATTTSKPIYPLSIALLCSATLIFTLCLSTPIAYAAQTQTGSLTAGVLTTQSKAKTTSKKASTPSMKIKTAQAKAALSWNAVKGAKNYQIKWTQKSTWKGAQTKIVKSSTKKITLKNLIANKTIKTKIRVKTKSGWSKWSNVTSTKVKGIPLAKAKIKIANIYENASGEGVLPLKVTVGKQTLKFNRDFKITKSEIKYMPWESRKAEEYKWHPEDRYTCATGDWSSKTIKNYAKLKKLPVYDSEQAHYMRLTITGKGKYSDSVTLKTIYIGNKAKLQDYKKNGKLTRTFYPYEA